MTEREFWLIIRRAILTVVDAIEERYGIFPRTSQLRKLQKVDK